MATSVVVFKQPRPPVLLMGLCSEDGVAPDVNGVCGWVGAWVMVMVMRSVWVGVGGRWVMVMQSVLVRVGGG